MLQGDRNSPAHVLASAAKERQVLF